MDHKAATPSTLDAISFARRCGWTSVLVVVAHPDDESFGLGALLAAFVEAGTTVRVLSFTRGEASTLGAGEDLGTRRWQELTEAASVLGVAQTWLLEYPDGRLATVEPIRLDAEISQRARGAEAFIVFETNGVTGHPDHRAATSAARRVAAQRGLALLEWGVAAPVAEALRAELGVAFETLDDDGDAQPLRVERERQQAAIACHRSQVTDNPVLPRRLDLQGNEELVRLTMVVNGEEHR